MSRSIAASLEEEACQERTPESENKGRPLQCKSCKRCSRLDDPPASASWRLFHMTALIKSGRKVCLNADGSDSHESPDSQVTFDEEDGPY